MSGDVELLRHMYDRFNARDIEAVLAALHEDVQWANGWEGGFVAGREDVRRYWTRQWDVIDPHLEPVGFARSADGGVVVEIHQTVRDRGGKLLADKMVRHIFRIEDGRIRRFDIAP